MNIWHDIDEERIYHWLSVGAQPSESVQKLFKIVKLEDRFNRLKAGEDKAALLAEAKKVYSEQSANPKTTHAPKA